LKLQDQLPDPITLESDPKLL